MKTISSIWHKLGIIYYIINIAIRNVNQKLVTIIYFLYFFNFFVFVKTLTLFIKLVGRCWLNYGLHLPRVFAYIVCMFIDYIKFLFLFVRYLKPYINLVQNYHLLKKYCLCIFKASPTSVHRNECNFVIMVKQNLTSES